MKVKDYIDNFKLEYEHPYEDSVVLKYINQVESNVYGDTIKEYLVQKYPRTLGAYQIDLPENVEFTDVQSLWINGKKYKKKDVRAYNEYHSYWLESGKLCFYPAATETDPQDDPKIRLVYQNKLVAKVIGDITTDTLLIDDQFHDIYDYYCMAKIAYLQKEYAESQNHMRMFNSRVSDYENWWSDHRPQNPLDSIVSEEEGYNHHRDFDGE